MLNKLLNVITLRGSILTLIPHMMWISIFIKETKPQPSIQTKSLLHFGHKVMKFHLEESIPCMNKSVSINFFSMMSSRTAREGKEVETRQSHSGVGVF